MRATSYAVAAILALAACDVVEPPPPPAQEPVGYGPGLGTAENPIPQDDAYSVRSHIERDSGPDVAAIVDPLRAFALHPSAAMDLEPLAATLPASLASQLAGWIDADIDATSPGSFTARDIAGDLADYAQTALTTFTFEGTMSFAPGHVAHTITGIEFRLGVNVVVPVGGLGADDIAQDVPVTVAEAGRLSFGDHLFGLAFGQHVWHGINLASQTMFGANASTALAANVDCAALAAAVAARCIDSDCVGHPTEIQSICESGITLLATNLSEQLTAFDMTMHYKTGTARLVDEDGDGLASRIADGVWSSELVMNPARGTFTATADGAATYP